MVGALVAHEYEYGFFERWRFRAFRVQGGGALLLVHKCRFWHVSVLFCYMCGASQLHERCLSFAGS